MTEQESFNEVIDTHGLDAGQAELVWLAALEWAAQGQEPVGWQYKYKSIFRCGEFVWNDKPRWDGQEPIESRALYTHPAPAVAVNEQMLAALKAAIDCGMVPSMSARSGGACAHVEQLRVADQIRDAIAAAEAALAKWEGKE